MQKLTFIRKETGILETVPWWFPQADQHHSLRETMAARVHDPALEMEMSIGYTKSNAID